jgi:hypothetical protein
MNAAVLGSGGLPSPAIIILAGNLLAIAGESGHAMVSVPAELAGFIARSLIAERMARGAGRWRRRSGGRRWRRRSGGRRWRRRNGGGRWRRDHDRSRPHPERRAAVRLPAVLRHTHIDNDPGPGHDVAHGETQPPLPGCICPASDLAAAKGLRIGGGHPRMRCCADVDSHRGVITSTVPQGRGGTGERGRRRFRHGGRQ